MLPILVFTLPLSVVVVLLVMTVACIAEMINMLPKATAGKPDDLSGAPPDDPNSNSPVDLTSTPPDDASPASAERSLAADLKYKSASLFGLGGMPRRDIDKTNPLKSGRSSPATEGSPRPKEAD